jgi:peptide subunit release factor 1 (eRF1)
MDGLVVGSVAFSHSALCPRCGYGHDSSRRRDTKKRRICGDCARFMDCTSAEADVKSWNLACDEFEDMP